MLEKFLGLAKEIVAEHKAQYKGIYYMKGDSPWTAVRDTVETAASLAGNYELPGSSLITDQLVSKGSQKQLGSTAGKLAQIGTGLAGSGVGSSLTGIPESAGGVWEGNLINNVENSVSDAANSASNSLFGDSSALGGSTTSTGASTASLPSFSGPGSSAGTVSAGNLGTEASNQIGAQSVGSLSGPSTSASPSLGSITQGTGTGSGVDFSIPGVNTNITTPDLSTSGNLATGVSANAASAAPKESFLSSLVPSGKTALGAALPLGELAYEAIKGPQGLPSNAQPLTETGAATSPLLATEKAGLDAYNSGTLTPSQQASIDNFTKSQQNLLIQQLASQGVTDVTHDSRYIAGMQAIQEQALAQQQTYLQQSLQAGLSAGGAASGNLASVANTQLSEDKDFQDSLLQAGQSLGSILAGTPSVNLSNLLARGVS